ncbi:TPA: hypothetical protein DDW69_03185 [candidate division CPR2 bacterium]|uniref:Glycerophosphoryl diester phosphodiesterase membrane domain-containing protein n=1 Tax=candidate division CPR2 bacterium GW2011_GWC1_41_48 TaxID=1618344 RepID=A0A0G0WAN6_UNCC2|nr:MAG: hypothetical protein UT47_C0003G0168 [candidate division CPR2 bacterium GW2011_GWC2_39_35]KKR27203.1 MAG: hypothetical protein UT59_C0066G0004 [candidate division CPR2 bacterium GW2011_GWD1_39_7]KKR27431.1 MAG: hypothetical protein UT60_C0049G0004 [candidate division CPR2 bacterium GW2011_GWD2_39_7]KKS09107.1 MAG: hypothetical protein UU65_C0003G0162 [candidate division CPR2 bacterium GW2011_GWC1_41_48]OGB57384.1 MAG: hypothetical protein A2Y27_03700 [candidate division CPR2 bacterium G
MSKGNNKSASEENSFPKIIDLVGESWGLFKTNFKPLLILIAITGMINLIASLGGLFFDDTNGQELISDLFVLVLVIFLSILSIYPLLMYLQSLDKIISGKNLIKGQLSGIFKETKGKFWGFLFVTILYGLKVLLGFILLIIPGFIFMVMYFMAPYIYVSEGKRGLEALRESKAITSGYKGKIFVTLVVLYLPIIVVSIILTSLPIISSILVTFLSFILITNPSFILYKKLRKLKGDGV